MALTNFIPRQTLVTAEWLNKVDAAVENNINNQNIVTVDTITAVNATELGLEDGVRLMASGRGAVNDGGGGLGTYRTSAPAAADEGMIITLPAGGFFVRDEWSLSGPTAPMNPRWWGALGRGAVETTALDAMFTYAATLAFKHIDFGAGVWLYGGSGMTIKGGNWYIQTAGQATRITRSTNGKMFVLDARTAYVTNVTIEGFRAYTTLADGARGNTHAVEYLADVAQPYGFAYINIFNVAGSGLETVVHFTKTSSYPWSGYNQLQLYYKCQHINISSDDFLAGAGNFPKHTVLYDSGTGNVNSFIGGFWRALDVACKVGDGDQACHDTTWNGVHFLGVKGGIKVLGPTNPAYYRSNIAVTGGQFDGATSGYTWDFENLGDFTVLTNNTQSGVGPRIVNASGNNLYEDEHRKVFVPALQSGAAEFSSSLSVAGLLTASAGATFTGTVTTTGAILTDTNGTRIGQDSGFRRSVNTGYLRLAGGNASGSGAQVVLWGGASAAPNRLVLAADRTQIRTQNEITNLVDIDPANGITTIGTGTWNGQRLALGSYQFWVDGSGRLRIKLGAPSSDTDGTVVGTQS